LLIAGWRVFFYFNERTEPIHVHCTKGDMETKYWLDVDGFAVTEAHAHNMGPADKRSIRRIIFEHFDYIVAQWEELQKHEQGT